MASTKGKVGVCVQRLVDMHGLGIRDAQKIFDEVVSRRDKWVKEVDEKDLADRLTDMAIKDQDAAKRKALNNKRVRVLTLLKQKEVSGQIQRFVDSGMSLEKAWHTFLLGGSDWAAGSLNSVAQTRLGLERLFIGKFAVWARHNPQLLKALKDSPAGGPEKKLAEALINKQYAGNPINELAGLMAESLEGFRVAANDAGLDIGQMAEGYIPHRHDREKMIKAGFDKFYETVLRTADLERTYGTASPSREQVNGTWEAILGNQTEFMDGASLISPRKGASLEHHREIHFDGARGWTEYAAEFGRGGVWDGVMNYLETGVRQLAVIQRLGPRPEETIGRIVDGVKVVDQATIEFKKSNNSFSLKKRDGAIGSYYRTVAGEDLAPDNYSLAKLSSLVRSAQSLAKLGGATLSAIADLPVAAMRLSTNHGMSMPQAWAETFANFVQRIPEDQRAEFGYVMDAICEGIQGNMVQKFDLENPMSNRMNKLMRWFFKYNGLTPWTDAMKTGMYMGVAGNVGFHSKTRFDALPLEYRKTLEMYGFDEHKWDVMRSNMVREVGDKKFLCPELARELDDDLVDMMIAPEMGRYFGNKDGQAPDEMSVDLMNAMIAAEKEKGHRKNFETFVSKFAGRGHNFLPLELKAILKKHDLEDKWDLVRKLTAKDVDGEPFISLEEIKNIPDHVIDNYTEKQWRAEADSIKNGDDAAWQKLEDRVAGLNRDFRAKLERDLTAAMEGTEVLNPAELLRDSLRRQYKQKLEADTAGFLSSEVNKAVLTPDERNRHALLRGTRPGTAVGEGLRFVTQFKSFPVLFIQQVLKPLWASHKVEGIGMRGALSSLGLMMAQATLFGGVAMEAKRLARGEKPYIVSENPDWLAAFGAAFTQGGGAGLYGDFLLGEYNRFGQSALESLAGPVAGTAGDVFKLFAKTRTSAVRAAGLSDDPGLTAADLVKFGKNNMPGLNIWYAKMALDTMFLWDLEELVSPGTQARRVKNARKEGREYWWSPKDDRFRPFTN